MLNLYQAVRALECMLAISLLVQCFEFLRIQHITQRNSIWDWQVQQVELTHSAGRVQNLFGVLFRDAVLHTHLIVRVVLAASLFYGVSLVSSILLFASTLVILIRWRGAFNGGSDFMTVVVLTGILIAQVAALFVGPVLAWKAGLWYISIHTMSSYFLSGSVKLFSSDWRNGRALAYFLDGAVYGPLQADSIFRKKSVAILCSWSFILWECSFPLVLAGPAVAFAWCLCAALFHFLVFWHFGLNRFFWAWLASFPAIIYCSTQI
jgi:hypothetical protein